MQVASNAYSTRNPKQVASLQSSRRQRITALLAVREVSDSLGCPWTIRVNGYSARAGK
jgi:hypothetical protein